MKRNPRKSVVDAEAVRSSPKARIIVLENESGMQRLMRVILESEGYHVMVSDDGEEVLEAVDREDWDLIISDLRMPKMEGLTFLRLLKERHPAAICIVLTAFGTWETAIEAMRLGAYTHLAKPFDTEDLRHLVARAVEKKRFIDRNPEAKKMPFLDLVGNSAAMNAVALMVKRIAPTDSTVLIAGESGTGKELVAQAIHHQSQRKTGPFVPVNCGAFTETLLESELFGHVKGAFTNAIADRKGLFETADGGSLFLDEVGEMSLPMQVKFLRVLETRRFKPVGGNREVQSDVRIIAATNRRLGQMVAEGAFRDDLFHRLNVIPIALPPLRDRINDVPLLTGHFLARFAKRMDKEVRTIEEGALGQLLKYTWPGNVRELENTIERAVALCPGDLITADDIVGPMAASRPGGQLSAAQLAAGYTVADTPTISPTQSETLSTGTWGTVGSGETTAALSTDGMDLERHLLDLERAYILQALERTEWNLTEAAKLLNMTFRSIRYRISKLNIERPGR